MRARARVRAVVALAAIASFPAIAVLGAPNSAAFAGVETRPAVGLCAAGAQLFLEEGGFPVGPEAGALFGWAMAAGDFNADGYDDLAVGAPDDDWLPGIPDAGSMQVRFGAPVGALGSVMPVVPWDNAVDPSEAFDRYGYALAAGDWNGDGHDDLAVGLPGNDYFNGTSVIGMGGVQLHLGMAGDHESTAFICGVCRVSSHVIVPGPSELLNACGFRIAVESRTSEYETGYPGHCQRFDMRPSARIPQPNGCSDEASL